MRFKYYPLWTALSFALGSFALADDATQLAPVQASAPDVNTGPGASVMLNASEIASQVPATSDTASLLGTIAGFSEYGAGGVSGLPVIDGLADERLHIDVNGVNSIAACANHMNPPLSYIDPSHVGSIQVYNNIVPVSVGGDSIGGAIIVNSPAPLFAQPGQGVLTQGAIGSFYRSNGNAFGGNLSATMASDSLSVTYNGSSAQSDNYTAGGDFHTAGAAFKSTPSAAAPWINGNEVGSTAYQSQNQDLLFAYRFGQQLLKLDVDIQHIPYQEFPNQRMDMSNNDSTLFNLSDTGQYGWGSLEASVYHQNVQHEMNFGDDKQYYYGNAPGMPMDTEGVNTGAKIKATIDLTDRDILKLGSEYQAYSYNEWWPPSGTGMMMAPNTFWNINDGQRNRFDLYSEWERVWNQKWSSEMGVRSDTVMMNTGAIQGYSGMYNTAPLLYPASTFNEADRQRTDQNWDWTAETRYTPDNMQSYQFGYAQETRSPDLYERYSWSNAGMASEMIGWFGDGNSYIGNLNLQPEVAHTFSTTLDWHSSDKTQWGVTVTPYYTYIQNYIDVQRCPTAVCGSSAAANLTATTGFVTLQFVNQTAQMYGVDIAGHALLAQTASAGNFVGTSTISYVRGENLTTGDNLYGIMPFNMNISLEQHVANWINAFEAQFVAAKTDVSQVRDELSTGGYSLLNWRASYKWKQVRLDLGIDNILNKLYALPLGGAYIGQGATMSSTGAAWGTAVPGMGRSIYTGLNYTF